MHFNILLTTTLLVSTVTANFDIITGSLPVFTNTAQASKVAKKLEAAFLSHESVIATKSEVVKWRQALGEYVATRTDAPKKVTRLENTIVYTEIPSWFKALPKEIKKPLQKEIDARDKIREKIWFGGGDTKIGSSFYLGVLTAVFVAGVALL